MNLHFTLASVLAPGKPLPETGQMTQTMREALIVVGAAVLLGISLLLWAAFVRKRKRHSSVHSHHSHQIISATTPAETKSEHRKRRRRHRRRRHSASYPRNPTLAETGGLPPVRGDEPPPPQQTQTQPP